MWLHVDKTSLDLVVLGALLLDQFAYERRDDARDLHSLKFTQVDKAYNTLHDANLACFASSDSLHHEIAKLQVNKMLVRRA